MRRYGDFYFASIFLICVIGAGPLVTARSRPPSPSPEITPRRIRKEAAPTIDGLLDDPIWKNAPVASHFVQREPREGEPATEQTEVRILYSDKSIFFGVRCFDSEPELIRARELKRDDDLQTDDYIAILLDTFHDHRNAYLFRSNARGTRYEALITDENRSANAHWDERWSAAGTIDSEGWSVEIEIPFTALRSRGEQEQTWGLNFERSIVRKNEETHWAGVTRDYEFWNVSQAGHLSDLQEVRTGLKLRIKPYVLGGLNQVARENGEGTEFENPFDAGLDDVKVSITSSVTADFTVNPDFAQVEVDESRVNLTRFSLFFPEKREFFLEGAGTFDFGTQRTGFSFRPPEVVIFYSRTIGLADDDDEQDQEQQGGNIPILGGAKVTGELGSTQFGFLNVQTREKFAEPGANFGVFRLKQKILDRSYIGGIFTNKTVMDDGGFNRVAGVDANLIFFERLTLFGFVAQSSSPESSDENVAYQAKARWDSDRLDVRLERLSIDKSFDPKMGFVRRTDVTKHLARISYRPRPASIDWIRQFYFATDHEWFTSHRDFQESRENEVTAGATLETGDFFSFSASNQYEFLEEDFKIHPEVTIPVGNYHFIQGRLWTRTAQHRRVSGRFRAEIGEFYDGHIVSTNLGPRIKINPRVSVEVDHAFKRVRLPHGDFTAQAFNTIFNYNFNRRLLTSTTIQYNNVEDEFFLNFRLNYIYRPGDDLFVVYNEGRDYSDPTSTFRNRTLLVKFTHSFDF